MTSYKPGDVVLVSFPFTDQSGTKKCPGVVVSSETYNAETPDVIILPITSQIRRMPVFGEFAIAEWQAAGLLNLYSSVDRLPRRIGCWFQSAFVRVYGSPVW